MKIRFRRILRFVAALGPAILKVLGVKRGTVADEAVKAAQKADEILPPEKPQQ